MQRTFEQEATETKLHMERKYSVPLSLSSVDGVKACECVCVCLSSSKMSLAIHECLKNKKFEVQSGREGKDVSRPQSGANLKKGKSGGG